MDNKPVFLEREQARLEDAFFFKEDQQRLAKLQTMRALEDSKKSLSAVSGIANEAVLQKLVDLNIRAETLVSLALVPLVEVAWADGHLDPKEKKALLDSASASGIAAGSLSYDLLESWLARRPHPQLFEAWAHYMQALCERLTPEERQALAGELIGRARRVAEADGGFLGLGSKISDKEQQTLRKLEAALGR